MLVMKPRAGASRSALVGVVAAVALLVGAIAVVAGGERTVVVGYVAGDSAHDAEDDAALAWLADHERFEARPVDAASGAPDDVDVLWVHLPDSAEYRRFAAREDVLDGLRSAHRDGARLFLTDFAALLPADMGIETVRPEVDAIRVRERQHHDKKGFQSFRGHPILSRGLSGGANLWNAPVDHVLPRVGYFDAAFPSEGRVAAVQRSRNGITNGARLVVEYDEGAGHILTAGAMVYLARENALDFALKRFVGSSLLYLAGELDEGPTTYWRPADDGPERIQVRTEPLEPAPGRTLDDRPDTGMMLSREAPRDAFFDLAGRRMVVMGRENGGIDEVWVHPFKVLFDYEAGLIVDGSVVRLRDLPVRIESRPESFTRIYETPYGRLTEVVYPSVEGAAGMAHYRAEFDRPARLVVGFATDVHSIWPYPGDALGSARYGWDEALDALHVRDRSGDVHALMGGDIEPVDRRSGAFDTLRWTPSGLEGSSGEGGRIRHAAVYELGPANDFTLNYAFAGTAEGREAALRDYRAMLERPAERYAAVVDHYRQLLDERVTLDTPDPEFDRLYRWALVGADRFVLRTPHLGTGMVAGYATTNPEGGRWGAGTPGYAWYFGRDGEWTGFAADDYGDFEVVRDQLRLLQDFQRPDGKIFHALNTAGPGVPQYNAADATPLYVVLAGHYLRASGDGDFIRGSWPNLERAMEFLYSTDTDGDGLIENTDVGHGWIEFGALSDGHSTFYLSGIWARALGAAAEMAEFVGEDDLARRYASDAERVTRILNTEFWNPETEFYNFAKTPDGGFNPEPTVLPAVPAHFGLLDEDKAERVLRAFAGNGFTSDWGVRIVRRESDLYDPTSYHVGSIWPLFTGWTALAEYEYGRSAQAFTHVTNNLYIKNHWALGYVEEVLHGNRYEPAGVTAHQAWSETNILHPVITGMVGWKPDAPDGAATVRPRFPLHWDTVGVSDLRVGESVLRLEMERTATATRYRLRLTDGPRVTVRLAPEVPAGMRITEARVAGDPVEISPARRRGALEDPIVFDVHGETEVVLEHTGGAGMIPVTPRPEPGDASRGERVIASEMDGDAYRIVLEGRAGTVGTFRMRIFDQAIAAIEGAEVEAADGRGIVTLRVPFDESPDDAAFARQTVRVELTQASGSVAQGRTTDID